MLRNSSALMLSFFIHAAIALGIVMLYTLYNEHVKEKEKSKPICLCLSQVKEKVVVPPPVVKELPKPPEPPKIEPPKPVKKKPVKKKIVKKVVKPKKRPVKKVVVPKKPEPIVEPEEPVVVVSEVIEKVIVVPPPAPLPPPKTTKEKYLEEHLKVIASLLRKNLYYPKRARKRRIVGEVLMQFTLLKNGDIGSIKVKKGSKEILNSAATKTIKKLSGKVPKPSESITIEIPIVFRLK